MHRMYVHMEHFSSINHMVDHKTYVNEFWKTEIPQSIITDHNGKKLEIKTEEKLENSQVSQSHSVMSDFVTPWTVAHQAPLSMEFSRPEYWSG